MFTYASGSFLAAFLFSTLCWGGNACTYKDIEEVGFMPPERSQDSTDFCYVFSALGLIQQHYCRAKNGCSFKEGADDRLSIIDTLVTSQAEPFGFAHNVLDAISKQNSLAKENCVEFASLVNNSEKTGSFRSWYERLLEIRKEIVFHKKAAAHIEEEYNFSCGPCESKKLSSQIEQIIRDFQLPVDRAKSMRDVLNSDDIKDALVPTTAIFPKECVDKRVQIPKFKINSFLSEDKIALAKQIQKVIHSGGPISVHLCTEYTGFNKNCKGAHVSAVSGTRQICCGGQCHLQFKLYDSWDGWVVKDRESLPWVDAEEVTNRIHIWLGEFDERDNKKWYPLQWIEPL